MNTSSILSSGILVFFVVFCTWISTPGNYYIGNFRVNHGYPASKNLIQANTTESDKLLVVNCNWDPSTLFFSDRKGLMLLPYWYDESVFPENTFPENYWKQYTYLYVCGFDTDQASVLPDQIDSIKLISDKYVKVFIGDGLYRLIYKN